MGMYKLKILPRDFSQLESQLAEISQKYDLIRINSDMDYCIIQENKFMKEMKHFVVKELPNSQPKIELLLNEMYENGYDVKFINDYSVIFTEIDRTKFR